jgi:hypothetical protein
MKAPLDPPDADGEEPSPGAALVASAVVYGVLATGALLWLWARGRSAALAEQAIGGHGPAAAAAVGLGVGVLGALVAASLARRMRSADGLLSAAKRLFAGASDRHCVAFAVLSAVSEELFFRLAVQDQFGLLGSVAACVLLNSTVGSVRWLLFTLVHATALGLLVQLGFGLLGSTTAHAVLTYLCLRRLQTP